MLRVPPDAEMAKAFHSALPSKTRIGLEKGMNPQFTQASAKRRRALLESTPPSNSRGVRLQTAAEGGGAISPPPRRWLPVVRTLWLKNSRSRAQRGEDSGFGPTRDVSGRSLQARLIACNLRHLDALTATSASRSGGFLR